MDFARGLGLYVVLMLSSTLVQLMLWSGLAGSIEAARQFTPTGTVPALLVVAVTVINPVFEEFLWLGYGVNALERFGLGGACVISVALRTLVHAYQGAMAVVGILPLGIVMTLYYAGTRRLWPVIVAHAILDAIALARLA